MTTEKPKTDNKAKGLFAAAALAAGMGYYINIDEGGRRLEPYLDSAKIPTACEGIIGPEVTRRWKAKLRFTDGECQEMEVAYRIKMVTMMQGCIPRHIRQEMAWGEWMAWGRWSYNTGTGNFCTSETGQKLQRGDHAGACVAMGQWTWQTRGAIHGVPAGVHKPVWKDGKIVAYKMQCADPANKCYGLKRRRDEEKAMCLGAL